MAVGRASKHRHLVHPLRAMLLGGMVTFFLGALLADWAYASTFHVQWKNFASWLILGGILFTSLVLLWGMVSGFRKDRHGRKGRWIHVGLLAFTFTLAIYNMLVHAQDGWASMPAGLILSILLFLLSAAAASIGFFRPTAEAPK